MIKKKLKFIFSSWLSWFPFLFGFAYSQDALFSSNQNTKFISGLAVANYFHISSDWMANITDPFPLFSYLLKWQYQLFGIHFGVHFSFFIIVVLYAIFSIRIAKSFLSQDKNKEYKLFIFSIIWFIIHFIGFRRTLLHVFPAGLAEQYLLGSYYQPAVFGVFLIAGIMTYNSGRPILATFYFILSPLFHPVYIVSTVIIAFSISILPANRIVKITWKKRFLFLFIITFVLGFYSIWVNRLLTFGDPTIRSNAHRLIAEIRIPLHSIPLKWNFVSTVLFFLVGFLASWLSRKRLLGQLLIVLMVIVVITIVLAIWLNNPTLEVIAPWRVSVIIAPISWIVLVVYFSKWFILNFKERVFISFYKFYKYLMIIIALFVLIGLYKLYDNYQKKHHQSYYEISNYLKNSYQDGDQYLVPISQKYIRLEAGIPVYVTWKSHPSKDIEFLQWYSRIKVARRIYGKMENQSKVLNLLKSQSISHIIWPVSNGKFPYDKIGNLVYKDLYYDLWEIK